MSLNALSVDVQEQLIIQDLLDCMQVSQCFASVCFSTASSTCNLACHRHIYRTFIATCTPCTCMTTTWKHCTRLPDHFTDFPFVFGTEGRGFKSEYSNPKLLLKLRVWSISQQWSHQLWSLVDLLVRNSIEQFVFSVSDFLRVGGCCFWFVFSSFSVSFFVRDAFYTHPLPAQCF